MVSISGMVLSPVMWSVHLSLGLINRVRYALYGWLMRPLFSITRSLVHMIYFLTFAPILNFFKVVWFGTVWLPLSLSAKVLLGIDLSDEYQWKMFMENTLDFGKIAYQFVMTAGVVGAVMGCVLGVTLTMITMTTNKVLGSARLPGAPLIRKVWNLMKTSGVVIAEKKGIQKGTPVKREVTPPKLLEAEMSDYDEEYNTSDVSESLELARTVVTEENEDLYTLNTLLSDTDPLLVDDEIYYDSLEYDALDYLPHVHFNASKENETRALQCIEEVEEYDLHSSHILSQSVLTKRRTA